MPFGEVKLIPGVNVERTPTLLEAGISVSSLIRFKDSLVQKLGGWAKFYPSSLSATIRDLHAWQDLNTTNHLLVGTVSPTKLNVITSGSLVDITPKQITSNFAPSPNFATIAGSPTVTITDANIVALNFAGSTMMLNTPVSVGGIILSGQYTMTPAIALGKYTITASSNAVSTDFGGGTLPVFTTTSGSATVNVLLASHGLQTGDTIVFQFSQSQNGVTTGGHHHPITIVDVNNFTFIASTTATSSGSFTMNSGQANIIYNPSGGPMASSGSNITATDWTSDNWGEIILACPYGGAVYQYDPTGGFANASAVPGAPQLNGGIFVSTSLQILFCWGSTQAQDIGVERDPMLVKWSDQGDYTVFTPTTTNQAGSFRIPIGSVIRGGMAVSNQNLIWTDLDLWAANYAGFPLVFGFNKIGAGAGAISSHAMQQLRNGVYWMGSSNFYAYSGEGVKVLPCPIWDDVFQNLNTSFGANVRAMPNTGFNEVGWLFPSSSSVSGECDSYVKFNITEPQMPWDYGPMDRSAWIDWSILGNPIAGTKAGLLYSHDADRNADGSALTSSFTTGYFYIAEGEDFSFVDQVIPDMKWDYFGGAAGATVNISFNVLDWPGDTPTTYGPYAMTKTTQYITTRFRGRQASITLSSSDLGSFWRLGKIRYRYSAVGRR